jgi:GT2 family glycosyltransferase
VPQESPSFDLVVATVGRVEELERFLDSLAELEFPRIRVLVVDQNEDNRAADALARHPDLNVELLRSPRGLSRARNAALSRIDADFVAFPDDDCVYPADLLERVAARFSSEPGLDGLTGRVEDAAGSSSASWKSDSIVLTSDNLWNRGISAAMFLRAEVVRRVGPFDESLGLGSGQPWASAEEIDYLIRAIRSGARIEYDPSLVVRHEVRVDDARIGLRDGASIGYLLRKHRYPLRTVLRMVVRPLGGAAASLVRGDRARASYYAATLRGRILGYRGTSSSKSS